MKPRVALPIDPLLPDIVETVRKHPIVLIEAEPGAGKTTRVPPALLDAGWSSVLVLEPRRIAARTAARRVAQERGEEPGQTVGYQVRYEEVSSSRTRLWFLTEGVLTRKLLAHGGVTGVEAVILDEFHERHLETDAALALLRKLQGRKPDLRIVLMSATLHAERLASALGNPPVIRAAGRLFPVTTEYTPQSAAPLEEQVASAVARTLPLQKGHTLVFLPGAAEIRRAMAACQRIAQQHSATVLALYGDLAAAEQDAALAPSVKRKIICSTNVAESSLTIDGVDTVIDSGLARVLTHSPWSGLPRLRVEKISRSSAIQRAGRAGRTGPGLALRLYPESDFVRRVPEQPPAILRTDLTELTLHLAASGWSWEDLPWLDIPSDEHRAHARELLVKLEAFDAGGTLTDLGKRISRLPVHPRLGRFLLMAATLGAGNDAALIAAQLSEGRLRSNDDAASDIEAILQAERSFGVQRLQQQLRRSLHPAPTVDEHALEKAFLAGYPDRVGRRRGETILLSNGQSARLPRARGFPSEFLVAVDVDDGSEGAVPLIRVAIPVQPDWLLDAFPHRIQAEEQMIWNREAERVEQLNVLRYESLVIDESRGAPTDANAAADLLAAKAMEAGPERFVDAEELGAFLRRVHFAAENGAPVLPADVIGQATRQLADGLTSFADLRVASRKGAFFPLLESLLPMRVINEIAPTHVQLPGGRRARIEYHEGRPPSVASRLQDFFGMRETPTVARGAVPLVVQLLAPNHRPVQVTTDLVSFWKNLYPQVRRELSRRYPKHAWPESPGIQ